MPALRSGLVYAMANLGSAGIPFLLIPVLTRALSPAQYGEVVSYYMLIAVTACIAGLSVQSSVGVRWMNPAKGDPRSYTSAALVLTFATSMLAMFLAAIGAPLFGIQLSALACAMAALTAGTTVIQGTRFVTWQVQHRALPAAALQVGSAALNLGLSLLAVFVFAWGGMGRIAGVTVAGAVVAIFSVASLARERALKAPHRSDYRTLARFGIPLVPHVLAGALLANADRFAVASQLGSAALGIYGTATQLGQVIAVTADAALKTYTPTLYRMLSNGSIRSKLRVVAIAYLSIPAWITIALLLWSLLLLAGGVVLGPRYQQAGQLAIWFLLGGAVNAIYMNVAGLFFFTAKTEWLSLSTVTTALLSFVLASHAVRAFGINGGGATYLGAQLTLLAMAFCLSLFTFPMPWRHPRLAMRVLFRQRRSQA